jgi:hypothetical protein
VSDAAERKVVAGVNLGGRIATAIDDKEKSVQIASIHKLRIGNDATGSEELFVRRHSSPELALIVGLRPMKREQAKRDEGKRQFHAPNQK